MSEPLEITTIAILGGSCFMGRSLVEQLVARAAVPHQRIVLLNRGNGYWGSEPMRPNGSDDCNVLWYPLDWDDRASIRQAARFLFASIETSVTIVDFSCETSKQMAYFLRHVCGSLSPKSAQPENCRQASSCRLAHYFLISSDSVYQCVGVDGVDEERPTFAAVADAAPRHERRSYSFQKALIEVALREGAPCQCTCTVLRLPDVIGPRDPTGRYWATLLWAQSKQPLLFPTTSAGAQVVSVVFSEDVASWLARTIKIGKAWCGGTFNLACSEKPSLEELTVRIVKSVSPHAALTSSQSLADDTCDYYPSVTCGPLDISRAMAIQQVPWRPTPLAECLAKTTDFFLRLKVTSCEREWTKVLRKLPEHVRDNVLSPQVS